MSPVKLVGKIRRGRLANNGKSKMAAPKHDLSQILEEMQKTSETGWDSLVNVCYEIRKVVGEFSFKESMVDEINVDFCAQQIALGSSGHLDSANKPRYKAGPIYPLEDKQIYFSLPLVPSMPFLPSSLSFPVITRLLYSSFQLGA